MSSNKKKISLDDIFNDDEFGLLDSTAKTSNVKTADQRLVDSFEEINAFVDKNGKEPNTSSMSEYGLFARLKSIRENEQQKISLKPFDRHNLLGEVEIPKTSIDDILNHEFFKENKSDLEELQPKKMNRKEFLKSLMLKEVTKPGSGKEETLDLVVVAHYKEIIRKLTSNYETKLQVKDEEAEQQREEFKESIKLYELKVKQLRKDLLERQIELKSVSVLKAQIETLSEELEQAKANNKHLEEDKEELSYKLAKAKNELASYLKEVQEAKTVVKERNYTIEMLRMEQTLAEKRKSDDLAGYIKKLEHIQSLFLEETLEEIETPVSKKLIESLKLEIYEMTGSLKSNIECLDATMKEISKAWQSDKAAIENSLAIKHESLKSELLELETNLNLEVRKLHGLAENSNRKDTRVAWFKEKVRELVKFKEQCVEKDHIAEKLRKNLEIAQEKLSVLEESSTNLKRNVKLKDEAIQKVNKDKESLENRISDMKLFFFTKFPDHLEVFQDYFKRKR